MKLFTNNAFFEASRGVRLGDHASPIMFKFVVDVFSRMLIKSVKNG
jgi:hypothetical protein